METPVVCDEWVITLGAAPTLAPDSTHHDLGAYAIGASYRRCRQLLLVDRPGLSLLTAAELTRQVYGFSLGRGWDSW